MKNDISLFGIFLYSFRLPYHKTSGIHITPEIQAKVDTGYIRIKKLHTNSQHPVKRGKYYKLTSVEKKYNRLISSQLVSNKHAIGFLKRFKILA